MKISVKRRVSRRGGVAVDVWCPQRGSGYVRFVVVIIVYMQLSLGVSCCFCWTHISHLLALLVSTYKRLLLTQVQPAVAAAPVFPLQLPPRYCPVLISVATIIIRHSHTRRRLHRHCHCLFVMVFGKNYSLLDCLEIMTWIFP